MSMTDRDRRAIFWGAGTLLSLALIQFVLLPWVGSWRSARARIAAARSELVELETQVNRVAVQRKQLADLLGPAAIKPLPKLQDAQVHAVKAAGQVLQTSGVATTAVRPHPARSIRELPGVAMTSIQVEGQGMFMQVPQVLAGLAGGEQLLLVQKLTLAPSQQQPGMMAVTLVLGTPALEGEQR